MAADVAHLAPGVSHYSWLARSLPWQLTNVWQEVLGTVPGQTGESSFMCVCVRENKNVCVTE